MKKEDFSKTQTRVFNSFEYGKRGKLFAKTLQNPCKHWIFMSFSKGMLKTPVENSLNFR